MITDPFLLSLLAVLLVVYLLRRVLDRRREGVSAGPPPSAIVVDGSNVMHWGGDPSAKVLSRVLRALEAKGLTPIVYFDANVGYRLGSHYMGEAALSRLLSLPASQICVVNTGEIADARLLAFAADHGLRVVSNDRYREWRVAYPHLTKKGRVLRGTFRNGAVVWRGAL